MNSMKHNIRSGAAAWKYTQYTLAKIVRGAWHGIPARWQLPAIVLAYSVVLVGSLWLAYLLRFEFVLPATEIDQLLRTGRWLIPLKVVALLGVGQFAGLMSYFGWRDLRRLFWCLSGVLGLAGAVWFVTDGAAVPPRSVLVMDFALSFLTLAAARLCCRRIREMGADPAQQSPSAVKRIGIIGAGDAGAALACELFEKPHAGMVPVLFVDDNPAKWNSQIHNVPVVGPPEVLLAKAMATRLDQVIIALPAASGKRMRELVQMLRQANLKFETVPSLSQLASGQVRVSQIRPVDIADLLGREPVALETENIRNLLQGRVVLVTGAGGSIGSELCRQIATYRPQLLLLLEQSEGQLFRIEQELIGRGHTGTIVPLIGNLLDERRLREIFEQYRPQVLFHAAAHKHVPLMECHAAEAIKNNTLGTVRLTRLAVTYGVRRFVFISTDKAINPTSVMGATKRLAEIYLQAVAAHNGMDTKFMAVRFGNVLDSSGSVVPTFREQIAAGGPVTVTHPEMTRYFMTIPEAVGLVLQSATQGQGGEIFVLDMGQPVKIVDLARNLIELSGLKPDTDIEIRFVGTRPGEKLFEEISCDGERMHRTEHPKIMRFISPPAQLELVEDYLAQLEGEMHVSNASQLKLQLKKFIPEYQPFLGPNFAAIEPAVTVDTKLQRSRTPALALAVEP